MSRLASKMNICLCGAEVEAGSARCSRCAALHSLDLESNATEDEIRGAYRLLVKVWHPDRFQSDQKLKDAADAKLKEVNAAFKFLTSTAAERGPWRPPSRPRAKTASSPSQPAEAAAPHSPGGGNTPIEIHPSASRLLRPALRILSKVAAVAVFLLLGRYLWIAFDVPISPHAAVVDAYIFSKKNLLKSTEAPRRRFLDAVEQDLRDIGLLHSTPAPSLEELLPQEAAQPAKTPAKAPPAPHKVLPYLTVGSTREEVLAQQGAPTASSAEKLVYGRSVIYLKADRVTGWDIDAHSSPIRVKLWPSSAVDPATAHYSLGSSKDVVLTVQGTPTAFTEDRFAYGKSEVYFRNGKVIGWKEDPNSVPLWAR
jgi:hypothetical protein